ncbi:MAG TPA: RlmE family RNA methyltransferase [Alphaproteobacteria bacterium]|nr:RlmE family RNA methyltransferase [Alphaproteobacteria bacterium]
MARGSGHGRGAGSRRLAERVKTAKGRPLSSTRWLGRQLNDPYVAEAKRRGYRSRAAFKLIEMDDKLHLLRPGARVVDLGAAPGGWTQVAAQRVKGGQVVALDVLEMDPVAGATVLCADFYAPEALAQLRGALGGPADLVLSDMAPPTTGEPDTDHLRIMSLAEASLAFALEVLKPAQGKYPGGAFVVKLRQGAGEQEFFAGLRRHFATVRRIKPPASRPGSSELYVVATGFRAAGAG